MSQQTPIPVTRKSEQSMILPAMFGEYSIQKTTISVDRIVPKTPAQKSKNKAEKITAGANVIKGGGT
jgi:hypothetical protein